MPTSTHNNDHRFEDEVKNCLIGGCDTGGSVPGLAPALAFEPPAMPPGALRKGTVVARHLFQSVWRRIAISFFRLTYASTPEPFAQATAAWQHAPAPERRSSSGRTMKVLWAWHLTTARLPDPVLAAP